MPSLNIKDYIIAALLVTILGLGVSNVYTKTQLNIKASIIEQQNDLAKAQKIKIELLKNASKQTEEYLNEKYNVKLGMLNTTIDGLRHKRKESLLPRLPASSKDTTRACFQREDLDEAISRYRDGVQELIAKGSEAVIGLDIAREWVAEEKEIYGNR